MTIRDFERVTSPALGLLAAAACAAMALLPDARLVILAGACVLTAIVLGLVAHLASVLTPDKIGPRIFFIACALFWLAVGAYLLWREFA